MLRINLSILQRPAVVGMLFFAQIPIFAAVYYMTAGNFFYPNLTREATYQRLLTETQADLAAVLEVQFSPAIVPETAIQILYSINSDLDRIRHERSFDVQGMALENIRMDFRADKIRIVSDVIWLGELDVTQGRTTAMDRDPSEPIYRRSYGGVIGLDVFLGERLPFVGQSYSRIEGLPPDTYFFARARPLFWSDGAAFAFSVEDEEAALDSILDPSIALFRGEGVLLPSDILNDLRSLLRANEGNATSLPGGYLRMLYLSVVTATTVGYSDITPITPSARFIFVSQVLLSVLLFGLFLGAISKKIEIASSSGYPRNTDFTSNGTEPQRLSEPPAAEGAGVDTMPTIETAEELPNANKLPKVGADVEGSASREGEREVPN